ncbi:MAG: hypothetical protein CMN57_14065 [Gammaproteobacteria bacterium]|nr:hypothetical protein [Gammaproteobacteria bacterium]
MVTSFTLFVGGALFALQPANVGPQGHHRQFPADVRAARRAFPNLEIPSTPSTLRRIQMKEPVGMKV